MLSRWLKISKPVAPYSKLAGIYDFVMRHVPYDEWARYLDHLFQMAELPVKKVLDIACGTGSLMLELSRMGYGVSGFDFSRQMVTLAASKLRGSESRCGFVWSGSMKQFTLRERYDAAVCTYDSLNYCETLSGCARVFANAANVLKPGGVFIFDITTQQNSKRHFRNYYDKDATHDFEYIRQSQYDVRTHTQINEFLIKQRDARDHYREYHKQRIYRLSEITNVIPDCFSISGPFDGFSTKLGDENSERVTFLLTRKHR